MKRTYCDPITGDEMTFGEHVAWKAMGLFRRWSVMILLQVVCFLWLTLATNNGRNWFNFTWSDLAIVIENVTMLCLFAATRRDQVVIRDVRKIARHIEVLLEHHGVEVASPEREVAPDT